MKCNLAIALGVYLLFGILEIRLKREKVRLTPRHFLTLILADVTLTAGAAMNYGIYYLKEYYKYTHENAGLYDEYYVDGKDVGLTFAEKSNLIYIILESLETSYADMNTGGNNR